MAGEDSPTCSCALMPMAPMPGMSPFGLVSSNFHEVKYFQIECPAHPKTPPAKT